MTNSSSIYNIVAGVVKLNTTAQRCGLEVLQGIEHPIFHLVSECFKTPGPSVLAGLNHQTLVYLECRTE